MDDQKKYEKCRKLKLLNHEKPLLSTVFKIIFK